MARLLRQAIPKRKGQKGVAVGQPPDGFLRILLLALLGLAFTGCAKESAADAGIVDASEPGDATRLRDVLRPFDGGPPPPDVYDAGDDAPDAGDDAGPWTSEWNTEPSVEIVDATPCEDWEHIAPFPRALPDDSTPRQLWRFQPELDPMYAAGRARFNNQVLDPVVSPDGTIWVKGPSSTDIMQVTRDGRMRRWYYTGALADGAVLRGTLSALPNGKVIVNRHRDGIGSIIQFDPNWDRRTWLVPTGTPILTGLQAGGDTQFAVGPGGMLYITSRNYVTATCQGLRVLWVLTNRVRPGSHRQAGRLWPRVMPDGNLVLSGFDQRVHRVSPEGEILSSIFYFPEADRNLWRVRETHLANRSVVHLFDEEDLNGNVDRIFQVIANGETTGPQFFGQSPRLSPGGNLLFENATRDTLFAVAPTYTVRTFPLVPGATLSPWLADGSLIHVQDALVRSLFTDDGLQPQWSISVHFGGGPVIDGEGRVYTASSDGLSAVQLDELPPPLSTCVNGYCNAHHDNRIRPAEE